MSRATAYRVRVICRLHSQLSSSHYFLEPGSQETLALGAAHRSAPQSQPQTAGWGRGVYSGFADLILTAK